MRSKCEGCEKKTEELCRDGYCKECHGFVTWEDCVSGTFNARTALEGNLPLDYIKGRYPDADWDTLNKEMEKAKEPGFSWLAKYKHLSANELSVMKGSL